MATNPLDPSELLQRPPLNVVTEPAHNPQPVYPEDSSVTIAEKLERNGPGADTTDESLEPPAKRARLDTNEDQPATTPPERRKGVAAVKPE